MATDLTIPLLEPTDSEQSAPQILERLVHRAEHAGASDIHLQMTPLEIQDDAATERATPADRDESIRVFQARIGKAPNLQVVAQ